MILQKAVSYPECAALYDSLQSCKLKTAPAAPSISLAPGTTISVQDTGAGDGSTQVLQNGRPVTGTTAEGGEENNNNNESGNNGGNDAGTSDLRPGSDAATTDLRPGGRAGTSNVGGANQPGRPPTSDLLYDENPPTLDGKGSVNYQSVSAEEPKKKKNNFWNGLVKALEDIGGAQLAQITGQSPTGLNPYYNNNGGFPGDYASNFPSDYPAGYPGQYPTDIQNNYPGGYPQGSYPQGYPNQQNQNYDYSQRYPGPTV